MIMHSCPSAGKLRHINLNGWIRVTQHIVGKCKAQDMSVVTAPISPPWMLYQVWAIEGQVDLSERWMSFGPHLCFFAELVTQPAMRVTDSTVRVQSSVVFTCFSYNTGISIRWLFNNQSLQLTERMTLSPSKCQLRIHTVRKEDAGEYQCEAFNPVSSKTSLPVSLAVMNEWPLLSCYSRVGHFCIEIPTTPHHCLLQISIHSHG